MFKQFFWKICICVVPVILSVLVIWNAFEHNRFKLGVDLVGGTILVYEIDTRKLMAESGQQGQDPKTIANNLAEKLKNRIDPNDLYNVVIRPAGGEGRVEIILPTGGQASAEEYQRAWDNLLRDMEERYKLKVKLKVPRGQVQKLTDKILSLVQQEIWEQKLYPKVENARTLPVVAVNNAGLLGTPFGPIIAAAALYPQTVVDARMELMRLALDDSVKSDDEEPQYLRPIYDEFARERKQLAKPLGETGAALFGVSNMGPLHAAPVATMAKLQGYPGARIFNKYHYDPVNKTLFDYKNKSLLVLMDEVKACVDDTRKNREIDGWFKQQAWRRMIGMLLEKYPVLKDRKESFEKIAPDAIDELVGRATCKGDAIGQAFFAVVDPMIGEELLKDRYVAQIERDDAGKPKDDGKFLDRGKVLEFVETFYGPNGQMIEREIEKVNKSSNRSRDLTVEEVQRIKDLVSKVGSLEFRILANSYDDKEGIEAAKKLIDDSDLNPGVKAELEEAQNNGLPPPPPREGDSKTPRKFTLDKLKGGNSIVTYSWIELGPQERQQLGLHNNALQESGRGQAWKELNTRRNKAAQIPLVGETGDRLMLQGALFYSRECRDRNMPEEERRNKKYEYFVLARNPELDPMTGEETPKIDGRYLISAMNQPGNDGRPAVSFTFNNRGGRLFGDVTRKNVPSGEETGTPIKRHLAIILDGLVMSAPTINSEIREHGQISGSFSNREVDQLVNILRAGALPATLKQQPVSESTMGATLGQDTIQRGLLSIAAAFGVVLLFMIFYYRFAGVVASLALLANLILTVGFMVAVKATFTLPGLAGLVLMLGMAVDANILIYERLREEREKGASILAALRNGYDRAFGTIIDTHLSSIFTAVVLYIVGNDQLKGFGVSLTVGLLISLFTSLYMTRVIFDLWAAKGWLTKLSMLRLFAKPDIDFMALRYYFFAGTAILTILGGALFIGRLPNDLNIDFVGGTAYSGQLMLGKAKTIEEYRQMLDDRNQKDRLASAKVTELDERGTFALWYGKGDETDKSKRTITLANKPDGETKEAREAIVAGRAKVLPDWAVEQVFLSTASEDDASRTRYFTVRTTEKEPDIVQAVLDQLLQEEDKPGHYTELLKKVEMEVVELKPGLQYRVKFLEDNPKTGNKELASASPSFVSTLLGRQMLIAFDKTERKDLPVNFELVSDDEDQQGDGRFKKAELDFIFKPFSSDLSDAEKEKTKQAYTAKIKQAIDATSGEFRRRPQPERLENFDSQLAAETRLRAMYAILLSWAAILLYLWFRFGSWTFGLAAVICLIHDLFFTLGIIAMCHYINMIWPGFLGIEDFKIDLPAVAALLTLVGYSVNDTIVVFDRIREVRGKNPDLNAQMINDSVNQTLSRTLLASLTTWLVVIVLYIAGGPGVHLFAFVMVVGVIVGTYSSIYVASPLLLLFGEGGKAAARTPSAGPAPALAGPDVRIQPAGS